MKIVKAAHQICFALIFCYSNNKWIYEFIINWAIGKETQSDAMDILLCRLKNQQIISNTNRKEKYEPGDIDETTQYIDSTINISEYTPFSSILTIHNLTIHHNGNYTCQIDNPAGTVEYSALLSVSGWYMSNYLIMMHIALGDVNKHKNTNHAQLILLFLSS